ncbi:cob(I)yrinic acid a,c-diamide adenosyltransferase [Gracilibacillus sp. YIM 98692]|uniref:cob(I)yrinic acid a,c-diamide adenosyltransferase n=1 Tax=Gracilibacillus sp. YIM 98692 TaxID=2663532 RepID=UPI0013D04190|nr:cob(I)yrinic acid a,c-diamide adenosyltransferase [Gracilibacillus sp. YIM 98692]
MRIYTRSGDKGETSLVYGERVPKNDSRVEAYGTCDELNAIVGVAISHIQQMNDWNGKKEMIQSLRKVQTILFHVGSELATPLGKEVSWKLKDKHTEELEKRIDAWDKQLPALTQFILPSGHIASTTLHHARTVVRRAERLVVSLQKEKKVHSDKVLIYLNRLSDFLFVAARLVNQQAGADEALLEADM